MNNKKTIIASIIGVTLLVVLVVGATFAYFTTVTSNDEGETNVTGKTDAIGSVALTNPTSNLHITLSALDMAQDNLNTYWATNDSTLNYDTEEVQRDIAVATLTGGEATTHYECSTTINVSVSGTMLAGLQSGDAYIQFGGLLTNKVDLKNVSTTGYPVTFALNGTDKLSDKVSAAIAIENRNANQNSIAGKELSVTFSNDDLECNVVAGSGVEDEIIPEGAEAFAIYSETDKSLRFYNNLDFDDVNVGDTYKDLKVTAIYTGFEEETYVPDYGQGIKVPWDEYSGTAEIVVIENKISPVSTAYWFNGYVNDWSNATIDLTKLDASNTTNMEGMFSLFFAAEELIGLDKWDTSNVTNMSDIFSESWLIPDDIKYWDTSNVTDMSYMFLECMDNVPDISGWDTSKVENFAEMFARSRGGAPNISNWDLSSATNIAGLFYGMSSFPDLTKLDVSKITDMSKLFSGASNIPDDIKNWDVSNVTNMSEMFSDVSNIPDISNWDVSNVTNMSEMFYGVSGIPDISGWTVSNVTNMSWMFHSAATGYTAANPLDLSSWNVSKVKNSLDFITDIDPEGSIIPPNFN